MPTRTQPTPDNIDIVSLFGAVRRSLRTLLIATAIIGGGTFAVLSTMAPRYASEAQLSIAAKRTNPVPEKQGMPDSLAPRIDKETMNSHVRSLMAPDLIRSVSEDLRLSKRVEFNPALGSIDVWSHALRVVGIGSPPRGENDAERAARLARQQLEVTAATESRSISIRFVSVDASLAADYANRLASAYRETLVAAAAKEMRDVISTLQPKVDQLHREVMAAEEAVKQFPHPSDQVHTGAEITPINGQQMSALSDELTRAEAARSEAEARWTTARDLARIGSADIFPEVQKSPLIQKLMAQRANTEREFSEASASLRAGHPRVRGLTVNLAALKQQIETEVQKIVTSLEKDFEAASLRAEAAAKELEKLKTKVGSRTIDEAKLRALESEASAKRATLERLQKQLENSRKLVQARQVPVEVQLASLARASTSPVYPKKGPYTLLALTACILIGLAWIIFRELVLGALGAARQNSIGKSPALRVPSADTRQDHGPQRPSLHGQGPKSEVTARKRVTSVAAIASRISEREGVAHGYRTMIVGPCHTPAFAALVMELASQLVGRGQTVLVIDWDPAGSGAVASRAGRTSPGLTELLASEATFEDVIRVLPGSAIQIIPPGSRIQNTAKLLEPETLNLMFDALDEAYDQLIFVGTTSDAKPLFEALEGRVDAGVRLVSTESGSDLVPDGANTFLGFEVEGIEIFDCTHTADDGTSAGTPVPKGRMSLVSRRA